MRTQLQHITRYSWILCVLFAGSACGTGAASLRSEIENLKIAHEKVQAELRNGLATAKKARGKLENRLRAVIARSARTGRLADNVAQPVPVDSAARVGPVDAWVTMVVFSDFQCPFCSRVQDTLKRLLADYPQELRIVFRHHPLSFHKRAMPAAIAAACAHRQGHFWGMHDRIFGQPRALADADFKRHARSIDGLKYSQWQKCYGTQATLQDIQKDVAVAKSFKALGTPSFFINGHLLSGAQPISNFKIQIERALKKARKSGVQRKDYYRLEILGEEE